MKLLSQVEGQHAYSLKIHSNFKVAHLKSLISDLECAYLLKSEALPLFAGMNIGFIPIHSERMLVLTSGIQRLQPYKEKVRSSIDSKMKWIEITHGPFLELLLASLTCYFLGLRAHWTPQRLSNEPWFSPDQNKRIFLRNETNWSQLPESAQPVTFEKWLPELFFLHWRYPGMFEAFCLLPSNPCNIDYAC